MLFPKILPRLKKKLTKIYYDILLINTPGEEFNLVSIIFMGEMS